MDTEVGRLRKICADLEFDLEETRKWATQCEVELVEWKKRKHPVEIHAQATRQVAKVKSAVAAEIKELTEKLENAEEVAEGAKRVTKELQDDLANLEDDYNTLYNRNKDLQKEYDDLKQEHDVLLVAMGM
jgi:chromosome segregation ATPase